MSKSLFSINGVTINTDYLLYIEPRHSCGNYGKVVAVMTGAKDEREVVLVSGLSTFGQAKYIAGIIAEEIDSEVDINISQEDLAEYMMDYVEEENEEDPDTDTEDVELEPVQDVDSENDAEQYVKILGIKFLVQHVKDRLSVREEKPLLGEVRYYLTLGVDGQTLLSSRKKDNMDRCITLFLEDIENGMTEFDSNYFYQLSMR